MSVRLTPYPGKQRSLCYTGRRPAGQYFAAGGRKSGAMSERTRKLAWAAVIVASATAISRIVGLGREVLTAGVYGVNADYNTFVSVSVVPKITRWPQGMAKRMRFPSAMTTASGTGSRRPSVGVPLP